MRRDIAKQLGIKASLKSDAVPSIDLANDPVCEDVSTERERRQVRGPKFPAIFTISGLFC